MNRGFTSTLPRRRPAPFPVAAHAQVWLDFDGTITRRDVLDGLIAQFSRNDSWKLVEERWRLGLIGSRECLREEFALLNVSERQLEKFLKSMELDPGLEPLLAVCHKFGVPTAILSDGIKAFILKILKPALGDAGLSRLPIRANALRRRGPRLDLVCPHPSPGCAAAHCKCASAAALGSPARQSIYVGDGRSDLCAAQKCEIVFAKGELAKELTRAAVGYFPFETLNDVAAVLSKAWGDPDAEGRAQA